MLLRIIRTCRPNRPDFSGARLQHYAFRERFPKIEGAETTPPPFPRQGKRSSGWVCM